MATTTAAPGSGGTLDFGRAFSFVTEDPDWIKKVLLGALFYFGASLLIGAPFVAGYALRVIARTARGEARPLPEWDDFGGLFVEGLKAIGLYLACALVFLLPVGVLGCAFALMAGGLSKAAPSGAGEGLAAIGILGLYGVGLVLMLALAIYLPAAFIRLALLGRFGVGFEVGENVALIRRNLGNYALAVLVYLAASIAAVFGYCLCLVGVFATSFWAICSGAWALGEVARRDAALWAPPESAPLAPY